jgi:serine/threonine-protein kinase
MDFRAEDAGDDAATFAGSGPSGGRRAPATARLAAGSEFGSYRVLSFLGEGGMGEVYEVEHAVLRQRHALKLLHADLAAGAGGRERFAREARVMASLHHPGIVRVDDFGETLGRIWLRMQIADGIAMESGRRVRTLGEWVAARGGRLPPAEVADAVRQILAALGAAHAAGLVHRDLKPGNILLDGSGRLAIADFGLVQLAGDEWLRSRVNESVARSASLGSAPTRVGSQGSGSLQAGDRALMGTWDYMSPEQRAGGAVDARSDLYAIGLIAFRMLTGESVLAMEMPSELVDGLDPAWDGWVRKAVASRAERRFASAEVMAQALPEAGGAARPAGPAAVTAVDRGLPDTPPAPRPERRATPVPPALAPPQPPAIPVRDRRRAAVVPPPLPGNPPPVASAREPSSAGRKAAEAPRPPPLPPRRTEPGGAVDAGTLREGFAQRALRLWSACLWVVVCPGLALSLRGRPGFAFGFHAAPMAALVVAGLSACVGPPEVMAVHLLCVMASLLVLAIDGRAGPWGRLAPERLARRARHMRGWLTAVFAVAVVGTIGMAIVAGAAMVEIDQSFCTTNRDVVMAIGGGLAAVVGLWAAWRVWRLRRFLRTWLSSGRTER